MGHNCPHATRRICNGAVCVSDDPAMVCADQEKRELGELIRADYKRSLLLIYHCVVWNFCHVESELCDRAG